MKRFAGLFAAAMAVVCVSVPARAGSDSKGDNCHCDQYKGLVGFSTLGDEVGNIGAAALSSDGHAFATDDELSKAIRVKIESNKLIPDECKKQLIAQANKTHGSAFARVIIGGGLPNSAADRAEADRLFYAYDSAYNQYLAAKYQAQCGFAPTQACAKTAIANAWSSFNSGMQSDAAGTLSPYGISASDASMLKAYQSVLSAGSEANLLAMVAAKKDGLNNQQFMTLVQMVGQRLGDNYDYARAGQSINAKGSVSGDQLLATAANNTMNGNSWNSGALGQYAGSQTQVAGVCRDIMTLQAKMLQARGFPAVYTLSYGTAGPNFHTIAIAGDPDHPTQMHAFSYSLRTDNDMVDGSVALFQRKSVDSIGLSDRNVNYYVSKPEGAIVATVPSEMGKFITEASGFDIRDFDPLARTSSTMMGAGQTFASADGKTVGNIHLSAGQDGIGARYLGVGGSIAWGQGTLHPGKIGMFVGDQLEPGSVYGTKGDTQVGVAGLTVQQHVMTPKYNVGKNTTVQVDNSGTLQIIGAMAMTNGAGDKGAMTGGADLRVDSHVTVEHTSADGKLKSQYVAGVRVSPGVQDVRNMALWSDPTVVLNGAYVGTQQILRLQDIDLYGKAMISADLTGARGELEAGISTKKFAAGTFIAGRLPGSTALVQDNSIRRVGAKIVYKPNKYVQLGVTGQMPIEGDAPLSQANIMGTAIVNW